MTNPEAEPSSTDLFILDDQNNPTPMPEDELLEWGAWMKAAKESGRVQVADDQIGAFRIRTHFCGCDHNWEDGPPVLFETLVTENNERRDLYTQRYTNWNDAEAGHTQVCNNLS